MPPDAMTIGLIEDDPVMGGSIVQRLELEGYCVRWWQSGTDALSPGNRDLQDLDLVVCDIRLPDMNGEEIYRRMNADGAVPPFLFVTGFGDIDQAVRLMRLGAADYLTKPFQFDDFLARIRDHARCLRQTEERAATFGVSRQASDMQRTLERYATTNLPVLITGETGVGKEIAARWLHRVSAEGNAPFMALNCAAIPAELLESEIFGHEKGAFTGAVRRHLGYAERAGSGTLFLDEIGDMPIGLQAKILRLIEAEEFQRIGGEQPIPFKARIVAATHRDLASSSRETAFREDLYFRLAVLPVHIAPLRQRPDDIPWLLDRLLADACARHGKSVRGFSTLTSEAALAHDWPGNVREMRNRIERCVALGGDAWIMPCDLFPDHRPASMHSDPIAPLFEVRIAAERRQIERALKETSGGVRRAAKLLGVSRTTLWEKMTRFGLRSDSGSDS